MNVSNLILDHQQILQKIDRIAYQVYEENHDQTEIIMAGIAQNGLVFAQLLKDKIENISPIKVHLCELHIDKTYPLKRCELTDLDVEYKNRSVIVVDDVLNSGKTLMYGLQLFLNTPIKRLSVAVLINRSHKRYPVNANYVGLSLATTLKEHIEVSFENPEAFTVTLS